MPRLLLCVLILALTMCFTATPYPSFGGGTDPKGLLAAEPPLVEPSRGWKAITTPSGWITLTYQPNNAERWVMFTISKAGQTLKPVYQTNGGRVAQRFFLPFGAGTYQVRAWYNTSSQRIAPFRPAGSVWVVKSQRDIPAVSNSAFKVYHYPGPGTKWLMVTVAKGNSEAKLFFPACRPRTECPVYLSFGAGLYEIKVFESAEGKYSTYHGPFAWFRVRNLDAREQTFLLPGQGIQSDAPAIVELARQLTAGLAGDMAKSRAIHDWVCTNIAYDTEAYFNGTYIYKDYSALNVLKTRVGTCEGYSNLNAALHRAAGIPARVVRGKAIRLYLNETWDSTGGGGNHAWNEVFIDGRWVTEDAAWDAGTVDFSARVFRPSFTLRYFDPDPAVLSLDHRRFSIDQR